MSVSSLTGIARRLLHNVEQDHGDLAEGVMHVPTAKYTDPAQYQKEMEAIFLKLPLVTALSVDIPKAGDYRTIDIAGRAVVTMRGEDGVARAARLAGSPARTTRGSTTPRAASSSCPRPRPSATSSTTASSSCPPPSAWA
jgi:hypothetical protein